MIINFSQKMFFDNDIYKFIINMNKIIRNGISFFRLNFGVPLISTNNYDESLLAFSKGDVKKFFTNNRNKNINLIIKAYFMLHKCLFVEYYRCIYEDSLLDDNSNFTLSLNRFNKLKVVYYHQKIFLIYLILNSIK